jgi:hypothetical protein
VAAPPGRSAVAAKVESVHRPPAVDEMIEHHIIERRVVAKPMDAGDHAARRGA